MGYPREKYYFQVLPEITVFKETKLPTVSKDVRIN